MLKNLIPSVIILLFVSFLQVTKAEASEGIVEIGSINGSATRCFVMSTLINRSTNYLLQIQCRNLIYPVEPVGMFYILWSNPIVDIGKETKPVRIGDIEFGKASFNLQNSFSSLFITKEQIQTPEKPSNNIVMSGAVKSISFLDKEPTPTIIPTPTTIIRPLTIVPTQKIIQKITPTPQPKGSWVSLNLLQALGLFIFTIIFIFAIIFFVISKLRKL